MRFAVQRGGGYGGMVVAFSKIWLLIWPDLCRDRKKRKDKMIFFLKKCEKKINNTNKRSVITPEA